MSIKFPGGSLAKRPLNVIWILDVSGSMASNGKLQALNHAIREVIPLMQEASKENPIAEIFVKAAVFSNGARWHISEDVSIMNFSWTDIDIAEGQTDMGAALELVSEALRVPPMSDRALPPVLILISDGQPTDDFVNGLAKIFALPWGKKSVRIAVAIGIDADKDILKAFMRNEGLNVLTVQNLEKLVDILRWVSTVAISAVSAPRSLGFLPLDQLNQNIIPPYHDSEADDESESIW